MSRHAGERIASAIAAALCAGAAAVLAAHHPLHPGVAVAALLAWMVVSWRHPTAWLVVLPACVPWLDFAPWTGWTLFSEFDLLLFGALAGAHLARVLQPAPVPWPAPRTHAAVAALLLVGLLRAAWDAPWRHAGWFDDAFSPLNALRVSKALVALALTAPLLREACARVDVVGRRLGPGMVLGVTVASAAALWERATYPGLLDLVGSYRTVALFWEMHVGGAAIDAYLALSVAWVAWALWQSRGLLAWALAALLALVVGYAALTTFSRGVVLAAAVTLVMLGTLVPHPRRDADFLLMRALMVAVAVAMLAGSALWGGLPGVLLAWSALGAAWLWRQRHRWHLPWRQALTGTLVLALMAEAVAVIGAGTFLSGRLAQSVQDYGSRLAHWQRGIGLLQGPWEWTLGLGAGRLPSHYEAFTLEGTAWGRTRWVDSGAVEIAGPTRPPVHRGSLALSQRLPPLADARVAFTVGTTQGALILVRLCETHLLYDTACRNAQARVPPLPPGTTRRIELPLVGPPLKRPAALSLSVRNVGGRATIDEVVLAGDGHAQWLRNGGFDEGLAHWLPVARVHFLPWHIDSFPLELLVERGLVALALGAALCAVALVRGVRAARQGVPEAAFVVASLAGAVTVGWVSSVLDVPRVAWLAGLMLLWCLLVRPGQGTAGPGHRASADVAGAPARPSTPS